MAPRRSDKGSGSSGSTEKKSSTKKSSAKKKSSSSKKVTAKKKSSSSSKKATTKKPSKAATSSKKAPSGKKPSTRKKSSKAGKASAKKSSARTSGSAPAPRKKGSWVRWLGFEAGTLLLGVALGSGIAGYSLWRRAQGDVDAWVARAPNPNPAVVWSAPVRLEVGQPLDLEAVAEDLIAAGYARVGQVDGPDQVHVAGDTLEAWTGSWTGPGTLTEGKIRVRVVNGRVAATAPDVVVLRPTPLARLGDLEKARTPVDLDTTSPWVEKAVLAMEDARFREHGGIDPLGIVRAVLHNMSATGPMHGGSTLTQQLAKNLFLTQERTAQRKVREAFFAAALESRFSKDELLETYLGEVYLGQVSGVPVNGVEQAARAWFGVGAERLTLAQSAIIGGVISAPNAYSPVRHPERAKERRDLALTRMEELGWASAEEVAAARAEPLRLSGVVTGPPRRAPWAVDAALEVAEDSLGPGELGRSGYQVHTTIQPHLQLAAEQAVRDGLAEVTGEHPEASDAQAALVAVRAGDGAVVALVGGRNYAESPFDRATQGWRQAGSTIKPLMLVAAFDADPGLHAASTVLDEPISRRVDGKAWSPRNYDGRYMGPITLRTAIEKSRNIPAVKLSEEVGPERLQGFLRDAGLSKATNLPSAALGAFSATPMELAGAYTVFPGGGDAAEPRVVQAIHDSNGGVVIDFAPRKDSVASARASAQATRVLQGVLTDGTGRRAGSYGVSGEVGGKTGTTDEGRDAWVAGATPGYAVVAWVGRDRGKPLGLGGSQAALPVWARFVADGGVTGGSFRVPSGLDEVAICRDSGKVAREACPHTVDDLFTAEQKPSAKCDVHGGPVVEAGAWLRGLFGRKKKAAVEGEGASDTDEDE